LTWSDAYAPHFRMYKGKLESHWLIKWFIFADRKFL